MYIWERADWPDLTWDSAHPTITRRSSRRTSPCLKIPIRSIRASNCAFRRKLRGYSMGLLDILKQYAEPGARPSGDVFGHFDSVAQQATPQQLGGGIAAALRSDATPAFGETIANLFGQSNPTQKAGVLNEIMTALGPAAAATAGGGIIGRILGADRGGAGHPHNARPSSPSLAV
jgi:hypothetical protein